MDSEKTPSTWDKMVHAPFRKIIKFDLIAMGIGFLIGLGVGAFLVNNGLFG